MAKKQISLGGKKFFSMVVLSSLVLGLMFTTFALQKPTNTESEATGDNWGELSRCNPQDGYAGGIQLYNENYVPNSQYQAGGYRIMCLPYIKGDKEIKKANYYDYNLGSFDSDKPRYDEFSNIWNFNNKANAVRLRVNPGCNIRAKLYNGGIRENLLTSIADFAWDSSKAKFEWKNLNDKSNKATSIAFQIGCR